MIYGLEILIHGCLLDSARTWTWSSLACFGFRKYFHRANFPWNSLATIFISFGVGAKVIFLNDFLYVFWTSFRSLLILVDSCWFLQFATLFGLELPTYLLHIRLLSSWRSSHRKSTVRHFPSAMLLQCCPLLKCAISGNMRQHIDLGFVIHW